MTVRVIGLGHADRGDDAAGLAVAAMVRALAPDATVLNGAADGPGLLAQMDGADTVILVDCARGGVPGTVLRVDPRVAAGARGSAASGHGNALAEALALGEALGNLPPRVTVLVIVGAAFGLGAPMSEAVRAAIPEAAARVVADIAGVTA